MTTHLSQSHETNPYSLLSNPNIYCSPIEPQTIPMPYTVFDCTREVTEASIPSPKIQSFHLSIFPGRLYRRKSTDFDRYTLATTQIETQIKCLCNYTRWLILFDSIESNKTAAYIDMAMVNEVLTCTTLSHPRIAHHCQCHTLNTVWTCRILIHDLPR